ncbi:MAG: Rpn family recombination-promoting nuclease/putative transposase [Saprospiraceae bacterium]|nr:Rpn family recombination-promoting nuclease/putative transposase [Saprospiraceae bacterium]
MPNPKKERNRDHDIFIKGILSLDELVLLLLNRYIPDDLKPYIDFTSLKLLPDAYIDNRLVAQYSDSVHECRLRTERLPPHFQQLPNLPNFRFCFLWEHKSSKPYNPIEGQVERYRYAIVSADRKNKRAPSIVIPIILYHGETKWHKKMVFEEFETFLPTEILRYLPAPRYIFIDIKNTTAEEIEKMVDLKVLRAAFIALKNAHNEEFFKTHLEEILKFVDNSPSEIVFQEFFKMLLEYAQRRSKLEPEPFNEIVNQNLEPDMATNIKTIFEVAEEKGMERGIEKGKIEFTKNLLLNSDFSIEKIALLVGVDVAFVKKVKAQLDLGE